MVLSVILVSGGTGFIGQALCPQLAQDGHDVIVWSRQPHPEVAEGVTAIQRLDEFTGPNPDAIINLAGASIADGRWTEERGVHDRPLAQQQTLFRQMALDCREDRPGQVMLLQQAPEVQQRGGICSTSNAQGVAASIWSKNRSRCVRFFLAADSNSEKPIWFMRLPPNRLHAIVPWPYRSSIRLGAAERN
jgi:hypothetical protein